MQVNLHKLLDAKHLDLTVYEIQPEDKKKSADISVADWKTALLAINVLSRRIDGLLKDLERAEAQVESLEHELSAIAATHEAQ